MLRKDKKSPAEIIKQDLKDPKKERMWVKYPGKSMQDITGISNWFSTIPNMNKLEELNLEHLGEEKMVIHNHPNYFPGVLAPLSGAIPSKTDFKCFLRNGNIKTMVVAQTDSNSGFVEGYSIFRKTRLTDIVYDKWIYDFNPPTVFRIFLGAKPFLDYYSKEFRLQYRFVPRKGYELNENGTVFVKKKEKNLEDSVANAKMMAIFSILGSILFLSSNITGNVIAGYNVITANISGAILFILGIFVAFLYLQNKKNKKSESSDSVRKKKIKK